MLNIVYKNFEPTNYTKEIILERIKPIINKFSLDHKHRVRITLEVVNSPSQAGADVYSITTFIHGITYKNFKMKRSSSDFFRAIADLVDGLQFQLGKENNRIKKMTI
jgi:ribosome-associated translation inhibitor RaiA